MLQLAVVCPSPQLAAQLFSLLQQVPDVEFVAVLRKYPSAQELLQMIRARNVQALLLSADELEPALALAFAIDQQLPGFPVITASDRADVHIPAKFMQAGVRDHLVAPISAQDLSAAIESARRRAKPVPVVAEVAPPARGEIVTFLPARGGVGATTVATAVSCALAVQADIRTLLMDCDLSAGVVQFLLQANRGSGVPDVLEHAHHLDISMFGQMVGRWRQLELLNAGSLEVRNPVNLAGVDAVVQIIQDRYEVACIDLASSVDGLSDRMLRASSKIFVVTTSEIVNLHMAAVRVRQLTEKGLRDRIRLVLNRKMHRAKMREQEVEQAVGVPVSFSLANDYSSVQTAILEASPLAMKGDLAKGIQAMVKDLSPSQPRKDKGPKRKFLEFFSLANPEIQGTGWNR